MIILVCFHTRVDGDGRCERGHLQLLVLLHLHRLLKLVVVDDVLVSRAALSERIQLVHVVHVTPQGGEILGDVEIDEVLPGYTDVLESGHELAVEAAHGVSGEEPRVPLPQVIIDLAQVAQECCALILVLLDEGQLQLAIKVFDQCCHFFVLQNNFVEFLMNQNILVGEAGKARSHF